MFKEHTIIHNVIYCSWPGCSLMGTEVLGIWELFPLFREEDISTSFLAVSRQEQVKEVGRLPLQAEERSSLPALQLQTMHLLFRAHQLQISSPKRRRMGWPELSFMKEEVNQILT